MKHTNPYKLLISLAVIVHLVSGCRKDALNVDPPDQMKEELVWKSPALAQAYVTEIYNGFSEGGFPEMMLASVSDEALFTHPNRGIDLVNSSTINPSTLGWVDDSWAYNQMYIRIRACNITIEKLTGSAHEISDVSVKDQLLGEVYFLRAYFYQQLIRFYGSVPLVTKSYTLTDDFNIKRSTYEECVDLILKDCNEAITKLAGKSIPQGRATELAAKALKARVLLYAASDLHDMPTARVKAGLLAGFAHPEYLGYLSGDRTQRWMAARDAAKAVIDAGSGYQLNLSAKANAETARTTYKSIAMAGGSKAPGIDPAAAVELILGKYYIELRDKRHGRENGPNGYHNWAGNTPVGLLVDDYEMLDGTTFSWSNPVHKANPYQQRDPRFYATILYDGAGWKPRDKVSGNVDPANQIQTGEYDLLDNGNLITFKGLDTRGSSIENWNGSWTGYYVHKFIDPDPNIVDANQPQVIPWPFFRYTEAVLNYVEACIELNELQEAVGWLNRIRFRAGMEACTVSSQAALRDFYRHERRIELAYEEQRYHDARRWMIGPESLGRKVSYMKVTGKFKAGKSMSAPYHYDPEIYQYTYTPTIETAQEDRKWDDKVYFRPFSRDEINRNKELKQNPGY